jgi:hypothetical protein
VGLQFLIPIVLFISIASVVRSVLGYRERMAQLRAGRYSGGSVGAGEDRLDRIEHAIDAIATEVERLSEAQQMNTRLLAERSQQPEAKR